MRPFFAGMLTVVTVVVLDAHRLLWTVTPLVALIAAVYLAGGVRRARRGPQW